MAIELWDGEEIISDWQDVEGQVFVGGVKALGSFGSTEVKAEHHRPQLCKVCGHQTGRQNKTVLIGRYEKALGRHMYYFTTDYSNGRCQRHPILKPVTST